MLSNKWTFSLKVLVILLMFGFVATSAQAGPFEIKIAGPTTANYGQTAAVPPATDFDANVVVLLKVTAGQPIPQLGVADPPVASDNVNVYAFNKAGFPIALPAVGGSAGDFGVSVHDDAIDVYPMKTPKMHQLRVTINPGVAATTADTAIQKVIIEIPGEITSSDPTLAEADSMSKADPVRHTITLSEVADTSMLPKVVSIQRLRPGSQTVVAAFQEEKITTAPFDVRIVLTEGHTADPLNAANLVEVENGVASDLVIGQKFAWHGGVDGDAAPVAANTLRPHPIEGMYEHAGNAAANAYAPLAGVPDGVSGNVPMPTGTDNMYHQYRVTITPHQKSEDFEIKIRVKEFHDGGSPIRNTYIAPDFGQSANLPNGRDILSIDVKGAARDRTAGYKISVAKDVVIPAGGYLVLATDAPGSEVVVPPGKINESPKSTERKPAEMIYNVVHGVVIPNLATQFANGVVIDVVSQHAGLVISEVMWGEDVSLSPTRNSQWIELYNPGAEYKTVADADHTPKVNEALTLIFYAPNEFGDVPAAGADGTLPAGVTDRIGTLDATGAYWSAAGKGQSGRSGTDEAESEPGRVAVATTPIVSMYRVMDSTGMVADGQMASSWMSSLGPKSANFDPTAAGIRHGTPGAATDAVVTPADTAAEEKAKADALAAAHKKDDSTGTIPQEGQVYISEIMFAGGGTLPQWIEIANGSKTEHVNLSGWTLTIANAAADADVSIGAAAKFTIPDGTTMASNGQQNYPSTILVVTEAGRTSLTGQKARDHMIVLNQPGSTTEVDLILAGVTKRKYTLLSDIAFSITLSPPEPAATKAPAGETTAAKAKRMAAESKAKAERVAASDTVGNLSADGSAAWALPMSEDGRSSIIRRHIQVSVGPAEPEDGTMAENWALAADTAFAQPTHIRASSYYGAMSDVGTPGFRAGGALPVELSHFRPARDPVTDIVVITWSTESELNNAGFFVKRSQQKDGEFKVINASMIAGAGTTSEKQFYTFTDTTAQPNVVYYYQIEDVSLDGNRQTLTRGIRLKGHVGAAGKLTTSWGELKSVQ